MRKKEIMTLLMVGLLVGNMSTNVLASDLTSSNVETQKNVEVEIQDNTESKENIDIKMDKEQVETYKEARGSSKGQAEQIALNKENIFTINKNNSYDWKKIVLPSDGYIDISIDKALIGEGEKSISLSIENEAGSQYFYGSNYDNIGTSLSKNTWRVGLAKGTYYLKWTGFRVSTGEVNLKYNVNFTETDYFEKEKNNYFDTATNMEFGQTYGGIMSHSSDHDYYCLDIDNPEVIVNLKGNVDGDYSCCLYDSLHNMINVKGTNYEDGGIRKYIYKNLSPGKYYIRLYNISNEVRPYEIKVEGIANGWSLENGIWYYYEGGERVKGEQNIGNKIYYFDNNGAMQTGWVKFGTKWYFYNEDGAKATGWLLRGDKWYYLELDNGEMVTGNRYINGKMYYFKENGDMSTDKGWILNSDSCWNYLNGDGTLFTGWLDLNGTWYYMEDWGDMVCNGVYGINGTIYYFNANGDMNTTEGWKQSNGIWYYSYGDGTVHCGWKKVNGYWYYMNEYGMMQIGWQYINGTHYYFDSNGALVE